MPTANQALQQETTILNNNTGTSMNTVDEGITTHEFLSKMERQRKIEDYHPIWKPKAGVPLRGVYIGDQDTLTKHTITRQILIRNPDSEKALAVEIIGLIGDELDFQGLKIGDWIEIVFLGKVKGHGGKMEDTFAIVVTKRQDAI